MVNLPSITQQTMIQNILKQKVVGVDLGYEKTTYAIVDVRGNEVAKADFPTTDYPDINAYISHLSNKIVELVEANGGYESIRSVGISSPSGNYLTGCIEYSPNLPWKGQIPLAAMMRDRLGLAVAVGNDAHVRALGESAFGSAHGMKDFILVVLGHGFGSCFFSNGHAHLGNAGFAGEVGHNCYQVDGRTCGCGHKGCYEAYCASQGVVQTARELMAASNEPSLMREAGELTPKMISEFCDQGDRLAIEVYRRTGEILGFILANYASVINPEAIILTGGITKAGKWLLEPTDETFEKVVFHNIEGKVKILTSSLADEERDVLGASVLAWSVKEYSLFK